MDEGKEFLEAIAARPDDQTLRSIYADWLDEHDMPEEATRQRRYTEANLWMDKFCEDRWTGNDEGYYGSRRQLTREELMQAAHDAIEGDEYAITQQGREDLRSDFYEQQDTFWEMFYILTGKRAVKGEYGMPTPYSCSC